MGLKTLYHKLGSPKWFYEITSLWLPWLSLIALALLAWGAVWGLAFAPEDYKQGNSYRIIYFHVPTAFLALAGYYIMAIAGAISLIWRMKLADVVVKSAAPLGAAFTVLALLTGMVWGKPTWGTYWVWDARNTSMLVLLFLYLGVLALYQAFPRQDQAARASALLALVGTVNIPIIYKSVDWWFTLHQPATIKITEPSTMHSDMWQPLVIMIFGTYLLYAVLLLQRCRLEILKREQKTRWVQALVTQYRRNNDVL